MKRKNIKILLITSVYRVGERIYPIIQKIYEDNYELDICCIYQMHYDYKWVGDYDLRTIFHKTYKPYYSSIYYNLDDINVSKYNLIIFDDNRVAHGVEEIYKKATCPMIGCSHGNSNAEYPIKNKNKVFDYAFVFGKKEVKSNHIIPTGIPSNDGLANITPKNNYILFIINFLGNRGAPFKTFTLKTFNKINLIKLQQEIKKPIFFKLKSRADEGNYQKNIDYLKSILPKELNYTIIVDIVDDNKLIANASQVIAAPSTLCFKSLQIGKPTAILKGYGQLGSFSEYKGLVDPENVREAFKTKYDPNYIESIVSGGSTFNSTEIFFTALKKLL